MADTSLSKKTGRPKRVSFVPEPEVFAAIAALCPTLGVSPRYNEWIYNYLLGRALHQWLAGNRQTPTPWANIMRIFEAAPELQELSDRHFDEDSPNAARSTTTGSGMRTATTSTA